MAKLSRTAAISVFGRPPDFFLLQTLLARRWPRAVWKPDCSRCIQMEEEETRSFQISPNSKKKRARAQLTPTAATYPMFPPSPPLCVAVGLLRAGSGGAWSFLELVSFHHQRVMTAQKRAVPFSSCRFPFLAWQGHGKLLLSWNDMAAVTPSRKLAKMKMCGGGVVLGD